MIEDPIARWKAIAKSRDSAALADLLADDVVFLSPVVHTPQRGRAITLKYLSAALHVLFNETFRYGAEWRAPSDVLLEAPGREILGTTPKLGESYLQVLTKSDKEY